MKNQTSARPIQLDDRQTDGDSQQRQQRQQQQQQQKRPPPRTDFEVARPPKIGSVVDSAIDFFVTALIESFRRGSLLIKTIIFGPPRFFGRTLRLSMNVVVGTTAHAFELVIGVAVFLMQTFKTITGTAGEAIELYRSQGEQTIHEGKEKVVQLKYVGKNIGESVGGSVIERVKKDVGEAKKGGENAKHFAERALYRTKEGLSHQAERLASVATHLSKDVWDIVHEAAEDSGVDIDGGRNGASLQRGE